MITVAYLPDRNVLCVTGIATPFPAGSLQVRRLGNLLAVASPHQDTLICDWADAGLWTRGDGSGFGSADEAYAYLLATCSQAPALPQTEMTVATTVGGHRVVIASGTDDLAYASASNADHIGRVLGVTDNAANAGGQVVVRQAGPVVEPSWSWTLGPVWVGEAGALTQTPAEPPFAAFRQQIAFATSATRIIIGLGPAVQLA